MSRTELLASKNQEQQLTRSLLRSNSLRPRSTSRSTLHNNNTKKQRKESAFKVLRLNPRKPIIFRQLSQRYGKRYVEIMNNLKDSDNECIMFAVPTM
jgi:hypothetical protein